VHYGFLHPLAFSAVISSPARTFVMFLVSVYPKRLSSAACLSEHSPFFHRWNSWSITIFPSLYPNFSGSIPCFKSSSLCFGVRCLLRSHARDGGAMRSNESKGSMNVLEYVA